MEGLHGGGLTSWDSDSVALEFVGNTVLYSAYKVTIETLSP